MQISGFYPKLPEWGRSNQPIKKVPDGSTRLAQLVEHSTLGREFKLHLGHRDYLQI